MEGDPLRWVNGKALNITEVVDGKLQYNPQLIESAVLAGLQWLETGAQTSGIMDEETAAGLLGISPEDVTPEQIAFLEGRGMSTVPAKRSLAGKIQQYWGVTTHGDSLDGYAQGIPESVAAEVLEALVANKDLHLDHLVAMPDGTDESKRDIYFFQPAEVRAENDPILEAPSLIDQAVLTKPADMTYFEDEEPPVAKTQMRNQAVNNTAEQQDMIGKEQKTRFYLNMPMVNLVQTLGKGEILRLFGAGDLADRKLNDAHRRSLEGKNRTIAGAFDYLMGLAAETASRAEAAGKAPDEFGIRPQYNISRVGRLQMLGRYNMQSTKLVREAVLSTRSTLDLSKENTPEHQNFMLGIAQALGIKVHKKSLDTAIQETQALLSGHLPLPWNISRSSMTRGELVQP